MWRADMMTSEQYVKHFEALCSSLKIGIPNLEAHILRAIPTGLEEFWGAADWYFKERIHTLALSSSAETYDLPSDFESVSSIVERDSTRGSFLYPLSKREFDRLIPKQTTWPTGTPRYFCVFMDAGTMKISFFPKPAGSETLYLPMNMLAPMDAQNIPERFHPGIYNRIAAYIYPHSSPPWAAALTEWIGMPGTQGLLARLVSINKLYHGPITVLPDVSSEPTEKERDWLL